MGALARLLIVAILLILSKSRSDGKHGPLMIPNINRTVKAGNLTTPSTSSGLAKDTGEHEDDALRCWAKL